MNKHYFIYLFIGLTSCLALIISFVYGIHLGFSMSPKNYEVNILPALSVVGVWFGSIATSCAVIVSLWLAFKQLNRDKEILQFDLNMNVIPGYQDKPCIGITITSRGNKPSNISSISWRGKNSTVAMLVSRLNTHSESLPKVISYGQRINILHEEDFEVHLAQYVKDHLNCKVDDIYLTVNTTTEEHKVNLTKSIKEKILEHMQC